MRHFHNLTDFLYYMMPTDVRAIAAEPIAAEIKEKGFAFVAVAQMRELLPVEALAAWDSYAESWNDLGEDKFMADGGRYRRRRHAAFEVSKGGIIRKPHQPHYQSLDHNTLNGGIERWFEPVTDETAQSPVNQALIDISRSIFTEAGGVAIPEKSLIEMHQFRIEPAVDTVGKPTPEGRHRDGVDWVAVLLANRINVGEGVTNIYDAKTGSSLGSFTLTHPLDTVFLDDHCVLHDATPIKLLDPSMEGHRDELVLTFKNP